MISGNKSEANNDESLTKSILFKQIKLKLL